MNEDGEHGKEANETLEEAVAIEIETEEEEIVIRKAATNTEEIDQKISKYIVRGEDRKYSCGFCGKSGVKLAGDIKRHIETHLDDLSFPCQSCEKTFKSRDTLRKHKNKYHGIYFNVLKYTYFFHLWPYLFHFFHLRLCLGMTPYTICEHSLSNPI